MLDRLFSKKTIHHKLWEILASTNGDENIRAKISELLEENIENLKVEEANPWSLIFDSRLAAEVSEEAFLNIIEDTYCFIQLNKFPFSLNDHYKVNNSPVLLSFFHTGGNFNINQKLLEKLVDCEFSLNSDFYNEVLILLQGYESAEMKDGEIERLWNFKNFYIVLKDLLKDKLTLNKDNEEYVKNGFTYSDHF